MRNNGFVPRKATRPADPAQMLGLLWAPRKQVGRSGLTVAGLTEVAIRIADDEGFEAVTMRRVAESAGVGAMTLYTYVPGRPELVELMVDAAASDTHNAGPLPKDWRSGIEQVAWRNFEQTVTQPWLADVPPTRPVLGPGITTKYEIELRSLDGIGLDDLEMDDLLTTVLGMVASAARWKIGLDRVRRESGLSDAQWWAIAEPVMSAAVEEGDYPVSSRVGQSVASAGEPEKSLRQGLDWLLDGVAARLG